MRPERFKLRPSLPVANLKEKLCTTFQVGGTGVGVGVRRLFILGRLDALSSGSLPEVWHIWTFAHFSLTKTLLDHFPMETSDM